MKKNKSYFNILILKKKIFNKFFRRMSKEDQLLNEDLINENNEDNNEDKEPELKVYSN